MANELQMAAVIYGNKPIKVIAGVATFLARAYGLKVKVPTVITSFLDANNNVVLTDWENEQLDAGDVIWFGSSEVKKINVQSGGSGVYYCAEPVTR